jgi:hypothetical protein
MPDEQRVSPTEILKSAGADKPVVEGTFLQRTGLLLAGSVGLTAAAVTLVLVVKWLISAPSVPVIPPNTDEAKIKIILDNYKTLQQIALEPITTLFDSIVVKVFLPVFTGILGYIFGTKTNKSDQS